MPSTAKILYKSVFAALACLASAIPVTTAFSQASEPQITRYIGAYAHEKISGVSFLQHSFIRKTILLNAPRALRDQIVSLNVAAPIAGDNKAIMYSACKARNCASNNMAIILTKGGLRGSICYFDVDNRSQSGWYINRQKVAEVDAAQTCPQDIKSDGLPRAVLAHIKG